MEGMGNQILKGRDCRLNVNLIRRQVGEYCNSHEKKIFSFGLLQVRTCFSNIDIEINSLIHFSTHEINAHVLSCHSDTRLPLGLIYIDSLFDCF